jgi:hypothetical protein
MSSDESAVGTAVASVADDKEGWLTRLGLWPKRGSGNVDESWFELREPGNTEHLKLLYEKTFEVLTIFLDWRYKSMTLGFTVLAGAIALDEWLLVHKPNAHWALAAPLLVAAIFCVVVRLFDARNQQILNGAYGAGAQLERALGAPKGAMMGRIPAERRLWTYHETIKVVFGWACVVCVAAAVGSIAWSVISSSESSPHKRSNGSLCDTLTPTPRRVTTHHYRHSGAATFAPGPVGSDRPAGSTPCAVAFM